MAVEKDFELLDDYISNRLSGAERAEFEQRLSSDPELAGEYEFQRKITETIKQARAAELKTMLRNVPISSAPGSISILGKIGIVAVTVGLISTGVYFYLKSDNNSEEPETSTVVTPSESQQPDSNVSEEEAQITSEEENEALAEKQDPNKKSEQKNLPGKNKNEKPSISVFDPSEEDEEQGNTEISRESTVTAKTLSFPVEMDKTNKKYNFHYQFKDGKLILFGVFENDLYEIMEFIAENKRTVFLFYKNNYYLLNDDSDKVKPLSPINDPALLKKLREYRAGER